MKNGGFLCLWRARWCCRLEGFAVEKKFEQEKKKENHKTLKEIWKNKCGYLYVGLLSAEL